MTASAAALPLLSEAEQKHAIRLNSWLPRCRERIASRSTNAPNSGFRYFTVSGGDALDVILLLQEGLLASDDTGLATVHFFDRNIENPQPRIRELPGARCFGGSFIDALLAEDEPVGDPDTSEYNRRVIRATTKRRFKQFFPFDAMNFDWDELLLEASIHGTETVASVLRTLFRWQAEGGDGGYRVQGFTIGLAATLPEAGVAGSSFEECLANEITANMSARAELGARLRARAGYDATSELRLHQWDCFLELGIPKVIVSALKETGWAVAQEPTLELVRRDGSPRSVLHVMLDVIENTTGDLAWYGQIVDSLFQCEPMRVAVPNVAAVRNSYRAVQRLRERLRNGTAQL